MLTTNKQCLEEIEHLKARIMNMEIGWQEQTKEWIEEEILAVKEVLESLEEMVDGWSYPITNPGAINRAHAAIAKARSNIRKGKSYAHHV